MKALGKLEFWQQYDAAQPPAVTQLFLMYEKPAYPGVYKLARIDSNPQIWCYWDGAHWGWASINQNDAFVCRSMPHPLAERSGQRAIIGWRGLADRPIVQRSMQLQYVTLTPHGLELA